MRLLEWRDKKSVFQVSGAHKTYSAPANSGYGVDGGNWKVYSKHWGASNLCRVLTAIYNGSTLDEDNEEADYSGFFNAPEQGLRAASPIKTRATGRGLWEGEYTTTDYLYAPRSAVDRDPISGPSSFDVLVAGANDLKINMAHWGGFSWLRSPHPDISGRALVALPGGYVGGGNVLSGNPAISAAFRLNLSSVIFTSAASAVSSSTGGTFSKISANTPMTLHLPATEGSAAEVGAKGGLIGIRNANGWRLME